MTDSAGLKSLSQMSKLIKWLAEFLGRLLAALLPAIGKEVRRNNTIEQKGYDDETNKMLDDDIWNTANDDRLQPLDPED